jgi:hypothetical protein
VARSRIDFNFIIFLFITYHHRSPSFSTTAILAPHLLSRPTHCRSLNGHQQRSLHRPATLYVRTHQLASQYGEPRNCFPSSCSYKNRLDLQPVPLHSHQKL